MSKLYAVKGDILYTKDFGSVEAFENGYILIKDNKVKNVFNILPEEFSKIEIKDYTGKLIIPGFVDMHLHAPQFPNLGLGLDKELIPWLETYTFPEESKFKDIKYSRKVYSKLIKEIWSNGTTRCSVFASIHSESTKLLMDLFDKSGLGAYVGKVNMDMNSPKFLIEDTEKSISDTESFIKEYNTKYNLIKPIITPRFVPSCSSRLLHSLGVLAKKYDIPVQSHLSENRAEIDLAMSLYPDKPDYTSIYDSESLLGDTKTIMAHCIHLSDDEIQMLKNKGVYVAHCPTSNVNLSSGIAPIRKLISAGVKVGLGTDISAGHTLSITEVIKYTIQMSNLQWINSGYKNKPLTSSEAFYLATKGGGQFFGKVGSFEDGYDFDALVIEDNNVSSFNNLSINERLQKFIYSNDPSQIKIRYVNGQIVPEPKLY